MWKVTICPNSTDPLVTKYVDTLEAGVDYIEKNYPDLMESDFRITRHNFVQYGTGYFRANVERIRHA